MFLPRYCMVTFQGVWSRCSCVHPIFPADGLPALPAACVAAFRLIWRELKNLYQFCFFLNQSCSQEKMVCSSSTFLEKDLPLTEVPSTSPYFCRMFVDIRWLLNYTLWVIYQLALEEWFRGSAAFSLLDRDGDNLPYSWHNTKPLGRQVRGKIAVVWTSQISACFRHSFLLTLTTTYCILEHRHSRTSKPKIYFMFINLFP